ncbi:Asp-tRNA(Asn)/Glu-tRNA(Gln) amidotransferase subunit GatC [Patescibacteria group bacterium]
MRLTRKQVEHTAKLARLGFAEKEVKKFQKDLSAVLDFIEKLSEIKTDKIEPTAHITGLENVIRADKGVAISNSKKKKLLDLASEKKEDYIKVKSIL